MNTYAAALLGNFPILIGRPWRGAMLTAGVCMVCVFEGWCCWQEGARNQGAVWALVWSFFKSLELSSYVDQSTVLCMYVNCTKCLGPHNLPHSAWHFAELFFWSNLSWSRADLCANSFVISTHFSLLGTMPSCTRYISYVGILRIVHNVLFRISIIFVNMDMDYL